MKLSNIGIKKGAIIVIMLCLTFFIASDAMSLFKSKAMKNKEMVLTFANEFFNEHKMEAAEKYVVPDYIQHNPYAATGREPMMAFFRGYWEKNPNARVDIKRAIAEGDLVAIHYHLKSDENDRGAAVVDIFRVEKGKIVEHWDVFQLVPEKSANENTMF